MMFITNCNNTKYLASPTSQKFAHSPQLEIFPPTWKNSPQALFQALKFTTIFAYKIEFYG